MKLLFDQNLSRKLVARVADAFPESDHVAFVGLDTASDAAIWEFAAQQRFIIVSKDSDFRQLAFLRGSPPKAVWLRLGNASTNDVENALRSAIDSIKRFGDSEDEALLVVDAATDLAD